MLTAAVLNNKRVLIVCLFTLVTIPQDKHAGQLLIFLSQKNINFCRYSVVGIATCCGLDSPEIEFHVGEILGTHPDWLWRRPSLPYNGCLASLPGVKRPGRDVKHLP